MEAFHIEIPKRTLALYERVRANHENAQRFAYYLEYLTFHLPEGRLIPALEWLIKNRWTGHRFLEAVDGEFCGSSLELFRFLTMKLEHEKETRQLHRKDMQ